MGGVGAAILQRTDTADIQKHAVAAGMCTLYKRALDCVAVGATSPQEVRRIFGALRENGPGTLPTVNGADA